MKIARIVGIWRIDNSAIWHRSLHALFKRWMVVENRRLRVQSELTKSNIKLDAQGDIWTSVHVMSAIAAIHMQKIPKEIHPIAAP